jgi:molybdate transport system permease protein
MDELWPTLLLSLKIATVATILVALVGVPLAYSTARRKFRGKSLVDALLTLPLILPPTVVGYLLLVAMDHGGFIGRSLIFSWPGAVVAAFIVSMPLLYLPAAFAGVEREMEDVARLMGAGPLGVFWHVSLPLARRGIGSGLLLSFARALGELGATIMVFGEVGGRRTLPISVYDNFITGDREHAWPAVVALTCICVSAFAAYNWLNHVRED